MKTLKIMTFNLGIILGILFSFPTQAKPNPCKICESQADHACNIKGQTNPLKCKRNICNTNNYCKSCKFCSEISCKRCKEALAICNSDCKSYPGCRPKPECKETEIKCKENCKEQICRQDGNCSNCRYCK